MSNLGRAPSVAVSAARAVSLLESLVEFIKDGGPRVIEDPDPKVAERRRKTREKVALWRARKKVFQDAVTGRLPGNHAKATNLALPEEKRLDRCPSWNRLQ